MQPELKPGQKTRSGCTIPFVYRIIYKYPQMKTIDKNDIANSRLYPKI